MDVGMSTAEFLVLLLQIIGVNIVLSGDNAVVIAMAARGLPPADQKRAIAWGSGAAVVMRIGLTVVAFQLLQLPGLKLVGALLLLWIAVKLLIPESDGEGRGEARAGLVGAIRTILLADLAMSVDNVIAVAAVAKGSVLLLVIGLAISIPLVVFASQLLIGWMQRWPAIITAGAALLGWVAGDMLVSDAFVAPLAAALSHCPDIVVPTVAAVGVVLLGNHLAARVSRRQLETPEHVAAARPPRAAGARHVLLAVDGSPGAMAAVERVVRMRDALPAGTGFVVDLINVQRGVPAGSAAFVPRGSLRAHHQEQSTKAFAPALERLDAAGITHSEHHFVGDPGRIIAAYAGRHGIDEIVMGTRGLGTHTGALLGSVTRGTLEHSRVPVLVVKV
jgi:YjbE family integral membrane protein